MRKAICSLNFMYSMERFATEIYHTQSSAFTETDNAEKMRHATGNEQQHAQHLRNQIVDLKGIPTRFSVLFWIAGKLMGRVTRCFGKKIMLRADILIERRAVKDYGYFLRTMHFGEDTNLLIKAIISDEEQHVKNWENSLSLL
jgi:demethoxyubiquinone hydroxylase (CLK1/Coq7/Cat5 family)